MKLITSEHELRKQIALFRKDTKFVNLSVETVNPIPKENINHFIMMTDESIGIRGFSNVESNLIFIAEKCGFYEFALKLTELCDKNAFNVNDPSAELTLKNYIVNKLRGDFSLETLHFDHLSNASKSPLDVNTGALDGYLVSGRYPTAEKLANDFWQLSQLGYLNIKIRIWDGKEEPKGLSEYCDGEVVNGYTVHIKGKEVFEVESDSKKIESTSKSATYPGLLLHELGMPLKSINDVCSYVKEQVSKFDVNSYADFLNAMAEMNSGVRK